MRRVVAYLRKQGINVWVDNEKLEPGTPIWEEEIEKAIIGAGAIVVSTFAGFEKITLGTSRISYAEDNWKHIFPILITGDERNAVPIRLTNHQRIDIRQNEEVGLNSLHIALLSSFEIQEIQEQWGKAEAAEIEARRKAELDVAEKVAHKKAESIERFVSCLDEATKGKNVSGLGIIFLNKIKTTPPFLGIDHKEYFLSQNLERQFTEHFSAKDFIKENEEIILGGKRYVGRYGDTLEMIAKRYYGNEKYASYLPFFIIANGTHYRIPFIDTNESCRMSSEEIEKIYFKADEANMKSVIEEMVGKHNLPEDEIMFLMELIYEAAKEARKG